ncbi:MAG: PQQ-binding-like beta-propeller repeat protein [Nitrosotalea sp.]
MKTFHLSIVLVFVVVLSCMGFAAGETDKSPTWTYSTDGPVDSIAVSSDGSHFVAGTKSADGGTIYYFDTHANLLWHYTQDRHILSVAASDDGSYVAAAGSKYSGIGAGRYYDGIVYFFDRTGNLLWKYDTNDSAALEVKMSFDGSRLAVDTSQGMLYLDKDGKLLWSHNDTSTNDHPVRITKDGSLVATKDYDKLRVFDSNGTLFWESIEGYSGGAFTFSDDGKFLVTSADPSGIDLFDRKGNHIWRDEAGMHFISASISENDSYIEASAQGWGQENSGGLFLFDNNARVLWQRPGDGISAISSDGSYIAMGLWAYQVPSVLLYDNQGNLLWQHTSGLVHSLAISRDGRYVLAGIGDSNYGDGSVQLFTNERVDSESNTTGILQNETKPGSQPSSISINSTNYAGTQPARKVQLWTCSPPSYPGPLAMSSNGSYVAVGTRQDDKQGSVYLLDNNGLVIWGHLLSGYARSVGISPDGRFVEARTIQLLNNGGIDYGYFAWFANSEIYIFDNTGSLILQHKIDDKPGLVSSSQDGSFVAASNGGGILYSDRLGKALWGYDKDNVTSVSVSPDGSFVAACAGNEILLLDKQGNLLWNYKSNKTGICPNIVSSSFGYVLAGDGLANDTGKTYLFDKKGNLLWEHLESPSYPFHHVFSSDGQYEVETTGNSEHGYGLTVSFNKLEYGSPVPEFPFAVPVLLIGIVSMIIFYRTRIAK